MLDRQTAELCDEIIDAAQELANKNAMWKELQGLEIAQRVAEVIGHSLADLPNFCALAITSYRLREKRLWEDHNNIVEIGHLDFEVAV